MPFAIKSVTYVMNMAALSTIVNGKSNEYAGIRNLRISGMAHKVDWTERVKGMLKAELKRHNVKYADLVEKLREIGIEETEVNIRNKIARGGFTAVFFVQCLVASGTKVVHLPED